MLDQEVLRKFLGQHGPEKKINFISFFGLEVKKKKLNFWFYSVKLKKIG